MSVDEDELDFELVTNARELGPPPTLRKERVIVPDWPTQSGKPAAFLVWELTALDYADFSDSGWTYKDRQRVRYNSKHEDIRFLAHTLRDSGGNRLWEDIEDAKRALGRVGKGSINLLLAAANRMNSPKEEAKQGNSESAENDS